MIWLEVINIRLSCVEDHDDFNRFMGEIQGNAADSPDGPARIVILRNIDIAGDRSIQIQWRATAEHPRKSLLGLNLAEALRSFGLIDHGVWQEGPAPRCAPEDEA